MQKIILSILCAATLFAKTANAQSWTDLGSNETINNHITKTAAFALYLQSSQAGEPCFSFIDDDFGPNNAGDFKIHFRIIFKNGPRGGAGIHGHRFWRHDRR